MDRVRVAVSVDSGILSLRPLLPRTRVTVVRPGWGAGNVCSAVLLWGALSKFPLVRAVTAWRGWEYVRERVLRSCRNSTLEGTNTEGEEGAW